MVRYLLSMVLPSHPIKEMGENKYRELRTICQALDCLLKERLESAGDILMQRYKSIVMGLRDQSERFGHYLEIIAEEMVGVSQDELYFARDLAHRAAKAEKLLSAGGHLRQGSPLSATPFISGIQSGWRRSRRSSRRPYAAPVAAPYCGSEKNPRRQTSAR